MNIPNFQLAAKQVLLAFREGRLGKVMLDNQILSFKSKKAKSIQ